MIDAICFQYSFGARYTLIDEHIFHSVLCRNEDNAIHILDERTHLSVTRFLPKIYGRALCQTISDSWATIYTCMLYFILTDQKSFFYEKYTEFYHIIVVEAQCTEIKATSRLMLGDEYRQPLCKVYKKLQLEHSAAGKLLTLPLTVKEMKDTIGPMVPFYQLWYRVSTRLFSNAPRTHIRTLPWTTAHNCLRVV